MQYQKRCSKKEATFKDKGGGGWTPMEAQSWKKDGCLRVPETVRGDWESRKAYIQAPWSKPPEVYIEEREQARTTHENIINKLRKPIQLYTDGSGYQGSIGAAVYSVYPSINQSINQSKFN